MRELRLREVKLLAQGLIDSPNWVRIPSGIRGSLGPFTTGSRLSKAKHSQGAVWEVISNEILPWLSF